MEEAADSNRLTARIALKRLGLFEDITGQINASVRLAEACLRDQRVTETESVAVAAVVDPAKKRNAGYRNPESYLSDDQADIALSRQAVALACLVRAHSRNLAGLGEDNELGLWAILAQRITQFGKDLQIVLSMMQARQALAQQYETLHGQIVSGVWDSFRKVSEQARLATLQKYELLSVLRPSAIQYYQTEEDDYFAKTFTNLNLKDAGERVHKRFVEEGYGRISPSPTIIREWIDECLETGAVTQRIDVSSAQHAKQQKMAACS